MTISHLHPIALTSTSIHPQLPERPPLRGLASASVVTHQRGGHHLFKPLGLGLVVEVHTAHEVISYKGPRPLSLLTRAALCHSHPMAGVMEAKKGQPSIMKDWLHSVHLNLSPDAKNSGREFLSKSLCMVWVGVLQGPLKSIMSLRNASSSRDGSFISHWQVLLG